MQEMEFRKYQISRMLSIRKLSTAHFLSCIRDYETPIHRHNAWEFVFCEHGCVEALNDGKWHTMRSGDLLLHPPNIDHCVRVGDEETTLFIMSFVCSSKFMKLFPKTPLHVKSDQKRRLRMIIQELDNAFELPQGKLLLGDFHPSNDAPIGAEQLVAGHLEGLLISLLRSISQHQSRLDGNISLEHALENHIAYELQEYIKEHLGEHITLESLSQQFHYSRSYLTAKFRLATGMSIMEYTSRLRIERAKELLLEGNMTVAQIAELLGYFSVQYFSHCFKQAVGCSPRRYVGS